MLVELVAVMLVMSPTLAAAGAVRRDPVTGKWVEASDNDVVADPRARDSRSGSGDDGGGFFGGLSFIDHRPKQAQAQQAHEDSLPSLTDIDDAVLTRDLTPHTSKYSRDLPIETNVQTAASAIEAEDLIQQSQDAVRLPTKVESYVHEVPNTVSAVQLGANALTAKPIGSLCRFQGFAPLTECPKEAPNGCVDRIPCKRKCVADGFFSYRCKGPQIMDKSYAKQTAMETPVPRPPSEDYVKALTDKLKNAMVSNDYSALARLIVNAQQGRAGASAAAAALAQISQAITPNTVPEAASTGSEAGDNTAPADGPMEVAEEATSTNVDNSIISNNTDGAANAESGVQTSDVVSGMGNPPSTDSDVSTNAFLGSVADDGAGEQQGTL